MAFEVEGLKKSAIYEMIEVGRAASGLRQGRNIGRRSLSGKALAGDNAPFTYVIPRQ